MKNQNAIVALVRGYQNVSGYESLLQRNKQIYENIILKSDEKFDFILFHEGNITKEHQIYIKNNSTGLNITFLDVKKSYPKTAFDDKKNKINVDTNICVIFGLWIFWITYLTTNISLELMRIVL
jgi:hypothetical protein